MKLSRFKSKSLLVRSGVLMTLVEIWLRVAGFQHCERNLSRLGRLLTFGRSFRADSELTQQIANIVDCASHTTSIYPPQCLPRSLVLHYYLRRNGQASKLRLGVQTITGEFRAHAWVECHGFELNESLPANELYVPFDWTRPRCLEHRV